jgi:anaerobic ribonucleoside-triphosphate reductase
MNMKKQERVHLLLQNESQRNKCLVYTRVMGYHRPVESFNIGKKGEHKQRRHFCESWKGI